MKKILNGFWLGLVLVFNAYCVGQKWRLTQHCRHCHNGQKEERREPVKLRMSTEKHVGRMLEGNQRFSVVLRCRENRNRCKSSKAAVGRDGKIWLVKAESEK